MNIILGYPPSLLSHRPGDVLLDQDFNIVGSQNTLHRLVESDLSDFSNPSESSFVELLSAADRPKFLDFVSVSASSSVTSPSSGLPRGLRVTLCGRPSGDTGRRRRSLSVDLFHVALPGYHLLAIKEDPESGSLLEEAPSSPPLVLPAFRVKSAAPSIGRSSRASSASSRNEA